MHKIVVLFFCASVIGAASALQCYNCQGSGCDTDTKLWGKVMCGQTGVQPYGNAEWFCLKQTYKDKFSKNDAVERKCIMAELKDGKPVYNCRTDLGEPYECPVCRTDFCNSAEKVNFSFVAFTSVILAFIVSKLLM